MESKSDSKLVKVLAVTLMCLARLVSASKPLPKDPFLTIWNAPSRSCERKTKERLPVHLDLANYGIVENARHNFTGEFMTVLYGDSNRIGKWPYFHKDKTTGEITAKFGGLPQVALANGHLPAHIKQVRKDINAWIPDKTYKGLAVIDHEHWLPLFDSNFGDGGERFRNIYRNKSKELVAKQHKGWNDKQINDKAAKDFDKAAKRFMLDTLIEAKKMRPDAHWGYYHDPYCYNMNPGERHCKPESIKRNNRIQWLFDASSSLYPSVYLNKKMKNDASNYIYGNMEESFRLASNVKGRHPTPEVFMYTVLRYVDTGEFYSEDDVFNSLKQAADLGSNGAVLWASSKDFDTTEKCEAVQTYIKKTVGPFVKRIVKYTKKCSQQECNNHGRCQRKDFARLLELSASKKEKEFNALFPKVFKKLESWYVRPNNYKCLCYAGWKGEKCNETA